MHWSSAISPWLAPAHALEQRFVPSSFPHEQRKPRYTGLQEQLADTYISESRLQLHRPRYPGACQLSSSQSQTEISLHKNLAFQVPLFHLQKVLLCNDNTGEFLKRWSWQIWTVSELKIDVCSFHTKPAAICQRNLLSFQRNSVAKELPFKNRLGWISRSKVLFAMLPLPPAPHLMQPCSLLRVLLLH